MLNKYMRTLRPMDLLTNPNGSAELIRGVYTSALLCRLTGEVTIAGGTTSGTVIEEGVERLIDSVRVVHDGFHLVNPIQGRELRAITRRMGANIPAGDRLADADAQAGTPISTYFVIPFTRDYLADPFETVLPPLAVRNEFHIYVTMAESVNAGAGSNRGSGVLVSGGDRAVTIDSLSLEIVQEFAPNGKNPLYLPVISVYQSNQFSAANPALNMDLRLRNRWDAVLLHTVEGTAQNNADLINELTFYSGSTRFIDRVPIEILNAEEQRDFPAVGSRAAGESDETGYDFVLMADNGKLGNVVDPRLISQPTLEFDVEAPASNPGLIRAVFMELTTAPGITQVQDAGR